MKNDQALRWTLQKTAIVEEVLSELISHAGLVIPDPTHALVLEVACTREGYVGVLLQSQKDGKHFGARRMCLHNEKNGSTFGGRGSA